MENQIINNDLEFITGQKLDWHLFKEKTILISGAAGFLPSYMVETFLYLNKTRDMNIKIICIVRNIEYAKQKFSSVNGLSFVCQDITDSIKILEDVDYIIHAASQATPKVFATDPVGTILPNTVGTVNLLNLAVEKKVKGFLFFSTTGVYGNVDQQLYPLDEDSFGSVNPTDIATCYIESKRMGENICIAYLKQFNVPIKIIRPSIIFGYGIKLDDGRSFADFISNILNKQDIILYSEGNVSRSYLYIADAVSGFFYVMLEGIVGEAYNVAPDREITIIDLANMLTQKIFPELNLKVIIKKDSSKKFLRMEFQQTWMKTDKLKNLGWKPKFTLEEGFKRTINSYK